MTSRDDGNRNPAVYPATYSANRTRTPELVGMAQTLTHDHTDTELLQTPATGTMATEPGSHPSAPEHLQSSRHPDSTHLPQSYHRSQRTPVNLQHNHVASSPSSPSETDTTDTKHRYCDDYLTIQHHGQNIYQRHFAPTGDHGEAPLGACHT